MPTRSISSCVKNYNSVIALKTSETEFARSKVQHRKKAEGMITWQKQDTPEIFYDNESGRSEEKGSQETLQTKQESSVTAKKLDGNQRNTEITCTSSQKKLPKILRDSDEEIRCRSSQLMETSMEMVRVVVRMGTNMKTLRLRAKVSQTQDSNPQQRSLLQVSWS